MSEASRGEDEDKSINQVFSLVMRSSCSHSQQLRQLMGNVLLTFLVPLKCLVVVAGLAEGVKYEAAVKEAGRTHKLGPPHGHITMAALEGVSHIPDDKFLDPDRAFLLLVVKGLLERRLGVPDLPLLQGHETFAGRRKAIWPRSASQWTVCPRSGCPASTAKEQISLFVSGQDFGSHFSRRGPSRRSALHPRTSLRGSVNRSLRPCRVVAVADEPSSSRLPLTGWSWGGCAAS